jgi:hypothetical protein
VIHIDSCRRISTQSRSGSSNSSTDKANDDAICYVDEHAYGVSASTAATLAGPLSFACVSLTRARAAAGVHAARYFVILDESARDDGSTCSYCSCAALISFFSFSACANAIVVDEYSVDVVERCASTRLHCVGGRCDEVWCSGDGML